VTVKGFIFDVPSNCDRPDVRAANRIVEWVAWYEYAGDGGACAVPERSMRRYRQVKDGEGWFRRPPQSATDLTGFEARTYPPGGWAGRKPDWNHAVRRRVSNCRSEAVSRFQLARMRLTIQSTQIAASRLIG